MQSPQIDTPLKAFVDLQSPGIMFESQSIKASYTEAWCSASAEDEASFTTRFAPAKTQREAMDPFSLVVGRPLPATPSNSPSARYHALPATDGPAVIASSEYDDDDDDDGVFDDEYNVRDARLPTPPDSESHFDNVELASEPAETTTASAASEAGRSLRPRRKSRPHALGWRHATEASSAVTATTTQAPARHTVGAAGKASVRAAAAAVLKAESKTVFGGGVRERPPNGSSMSVEERVLYIFGEEALRLDRDTFKLWRSNTEIPTLSSAEQQTLKRLRRRLLGRTYAKRSRDRQLQHASSVETSCEKLRRENATMNKKIERLQKLIEALERQKQLSRMQ
jgi:hypothetical protein